MTAVPADLAPGLLARLGVLGVDHVAVTTRRFEEMLADYLSKPGAELAKGPGWNPTQKVDYAFVAMGGGLTVEILGLKEGVASPIEQHVRRGGGAHHLCFLVADIDVALAEVKAGRYKTLAWTTGYTEYTVSLMVKPNDPAKALPDVKGRRLVTPDPDSITAWMVRAMLRSASMSPDKDLKIMTTRYQDAVPFYLEYGFADIGATAASSVVKEWTDKGGKVFLKSRSVPIKYFIVSSKVSADEQERLWQAAKRAEGLK